jgi:hypothetical protein
MNKIDALMQQNTSSVSPLNTYWQIGEYIVMFEQEGHIKARQGTALLEYLALEFTEKYGTGFSRYNLFRMVKLFLFFPLVATPFNNRLTWSHYVEILKANSYDEINFYETQAEKNNWSVRQLKQQMKNQLYQQLLPMIKTHQLNI